MLLLLLALSVLNLSLLLMFGWILYLVSGRQGQILQTLLSIQRVLNAFDRPETLAQSAVEVGQSWVPSAHEQASLSAQWESDSQQRAGFAKSKSAWRKQTA